MADLSVFFITNRNLSTKGKHRWFGSRFNEDGPHALRFGTARGRKDPDSQYDYVVDSVDIAPESLKDISDKNRVIGSRKVFKALRKKMSGKGACDTLVLIHGYASTFESSLQRGLQLADLYRPNGKPLNVVVFSWPANGEMIPYMSYFSDRSDARDSGEAMARAFLILRDYIVSLKDGEHCDRAIHLLAHSMGNYALRHGVQRLHQRLGRAMPRLFSEIVLAAADEDDDALSDMLKLKPLPEIGRRVSVYFAPQDRALVISDTTKGNPDRLGSDGPKLIDNLPAKVVLVDSRDVAFEGTPWTAHQYYRTSPRVAEDITTTLSGLPVDRIPGRTYIPDQRAWRIQPG